MSQSEASKTTFNFPHPELTRIEGKPDFAALQILQRELFSNASSVYSPNGNTRLGHAVIVLGEAAYNQRANANNPPGVAPNAFDWQPLPVPPMQPVIPPAATRNQFSLAITEWELQTKNYTTYNNVEHALKQQLLAAVDSTFICSLRDNLEGYAHVTTFRLLEHLTTTYGVLDEIQLRKNMTTLALPWEPAESLEPLWQRCLDCQQVAAAGNDPITEATLLRTMLGVLQNTGFFELDLDAWNEKPLADKTWPNFKEFFTRANKKRCDKLTAGKLQHHGFLAIDGPNRPNTPSTTKTGGSHVSPSPLTVDTKGTMMYYCWSHGLGTNPDHTSCTCTRKKTGHQEDATADNMMGGNNTIRRQKGERNKFAELNPRQPRRGEQATPPVQN